MAKATGNYASITRGVSQQAPADRIEGQHGEVLNMLNDPVRGIVRRNGTVIEDHKYQTISGSVDDATTDSFSFRTYGYQDGTKQLDVIYRSRNKVGVSANHLTGLLVFDKTPVTGAGWVDVVSDVADSELAAFLNGGISAITALGSYVIMAGNSVLPSYSVQNQMIGRTWSASGVAWVRGGAYARTYTIKAVRASDSAAFTATYTTKAASYPGSLDTSGISYTDPDYQKQINDLTYAYNASVNQWIAAASEDIVPANIAQKLIDALTTAGFSGWTRSGSHIGSTDLSYLEVTDGGDGSLLVGLLTNTSAADEVTDQHYLGKVVRVQPKTANDGAFFLRAEARDGDAAGTGLRPVIWREWAGELQTPINLFALGVLHEGSFYLASSPSGLEALVLAETGDTLDVPGYVASVAGDTDSSKPPHFYGRRITALSLFQDRLLIASDSTLNLSRPGDYFNFYRSSILTVADDDPIEAYALGTESDTIRQAVVFDRNLLLYGDKYHYFVNGRAVQTPSTFAPAAQYAIAQTAGAAPASTGTQLFCLKEDTQLGAARLMHTKQGAFQDSPQLSDDSRQLRDYVNGTPAEVVALSNPEIVFIRTEHFLKSTGGFPRARPWGLYVYQYMDEDDGTRKWDAWGAWEWSSALGTPIGIAATASSDALLIYTLAWGRNQNGAMTRGLLAMSVSARPDPTGLPYLDGMRRADRADDDGLLTKNAAPSIKAVTFTSPGAAHSYNPMPATSDSARFVGLEHPHYTMGDGPAEAVDPYRWTGVQGNYDDYVAAYPAGFRDDLWTGVHFPAYVDITSPFVRDHKGRAKTWGTLTLGRIRATLIRTAGFEAQWIDHVGTKTTEHFAGSFERIRYGVNLWIGRNAREVQVRLAAKDWLPLTINALEWAGQWFESKN